MEADLKDLRNWGWSVAVHNDYQLNGEPMTFWLFTKDNLCIKGEGLTDTEALLQAKERALELEKVRPVLLMRLLALQPKCTFRNAKGDKCCKKHATHIDERCTPEWSCDDHAVMAHRELETAGLIRRLTTNVDVGGEVRYSATEQPERKGEDG